MSEVLTRRRNADDMTWSDIEDMMGEWADDNLRRRVESIIEDDSDLITVHNLDEKLADYDTATKDHVADKLEDLREEIRSGGLVPELLGAQIQPLVKAGLRDAVATELADLYEPSRLEDACREMFAKLPAERRLALIVALLVRD